MQNFLNYIVITLSLFTATGVLVHEAGIDRAAQANLAKRTQAAAHVQSPADANLSSEPHTHPQHGGKTLRGFTYKNPAFPSRAQRVKKFLQQNHEPRGRHAFDNYNLPVIA